MTGRVVAGATAVLAALALASAGAASEARPTLAELEKEIICPTCHTTLALSSSPIADRMRAFIRARIAAGDTKSEIKGRLVSEFGEAVLAAPPKRGFNLLVWVLPLAGIILAGAAIGLLLVRSARARAPSGPGEPPAAGPGPLDPELDRRLDEELARFEA